MAKIKKRKSFSSQGNISTLNRNKKLYCFQSCITKFVQIGFYTEKLLGTQTYIVITPDSNEGDVITGDIKTSNEGDVTALQAS